MVTLINALRHAAASAALPRSASAAAKPPPIAVEIAVKS